MAVVILNALHTLCEVEKTHLLTKLGMSVKKSKRAGFFLIQNCSTFLHVEGSIAWLYVCPHLRSQYT